MSLSNDYKATIITLSTRAMNREYDDTSGQYLVDSMQKKGFTTNYYLISDNEYDLENIILEESQKVDLIITTGGTGLNSDDITVNVVEKIMDYEVRGMSILLHQLNLEKKLSAMFSRALVAVKNNTIIMTLPGSYKAVSEIIPLFIDHFEHGLAHLKGMKHK